VQNAEKDRKSAQSLLEQTFGGNRRAVRISFTYKPLADMVKADKDDQFHIKFDFHHAAFANILRQHPEVAQPLSRFVNSVKRAVMLDNAS